MVSNRCKDAVKEELKKLSLHFVILELGTVEIMETLTEENRALLQKGLLASGLELMDDKKAILIEKIKTIIIEMIHYSDENIKINNYTNDSFILRKQYQDKIKKYYDMKTEFNNRKLEYEKEIIITKNDELKKILTEKIKQISNDILPRLNNLLDKLFYQD